MCWGDGCVGGGDVCGWMFVCRGGMSQNLDGFVAGRCLCVGVIVWKVVCRGGRERLFGWMFVCRGHILDGCVCVAFYVGVILCVNTCVY